MDHHHPLGPGTDRRPATAQLFAFATGQDIPTDRYQERFNQTCDTDFLLVVDGHPEVDYQVSDSLDDDRRPFMTRLITPRILARIAPSLKSVKLNRGAGDAVSLKGGGEWNNMTDAVADSEQVA